MSVIPDVEVEKDWATIERRKKDDSAYAWLMICGSAIGYSNLF